MSQSELQIFLPPVADQSQLLDFSLVALTEAIWQIAPDKVSGGVLGGRFGYGARWDNDVFLMHPYCWCESDDCPWCSGCGCVPPEEHYVDGERVENWYEATKHMIPGYGKPGFDEAIEARNARIGVIYPGIVHVCGHPWARDMPRRGIFGPNQSAPNFWHKKSGLSVHWYKWIGRDMETNIPDGVDVAAVFRECLSSLGNTP